MASTALTSKPGSIITTSIKAVFRAGMKASPLKTRQPLLPFLYLRTDKEPPERFARALCPTELHVPILSSDLFTFDAQHLIKLRVRAGAETPARA